MVEMVGKKAVVCCCLCMVRVLIMSHNLHKKFEVNWIRIDSFRM
jgi:hypothetical protein